MDSYSLEIKKNADGTSLSTETFGSFLGGVYRVGDEYQC